jgi:cation diffusion facilitator family transporter
MSASPQEHGHVFLGAGHSANERKAWSVITLCAAMMVIEIGGGIAFHSLALVADGLHMSTHAVALLIAALAYTFARRHAQDSRFVFGTGKVGDLAGFTSALILAMIALFIGYEAMTRLFHPVKIEFREAIPIAFLGLLVNIASAWMLSGGEHGHSHGGHGHTHGDGHEPHADTAHRVSSPHGPLVLEVFEAGVPPRFRARRESGEALHEEVAMTIETIRDNGERQSFMFVSHGAYLESVDEIPEPHEFRALVRFPAAASAEDQELLFVEHDHGGHSHRDHNLRAAFIHVLGDAAVSVLAILALLSGRYLGWTWMDAVMGIVGAGVIAMWAYTLVRDTSSVLLDISPDRRLADKIRMLVESRGDRVTDLHLWRLGPGHLGLILSIAPRVERSAGRYRDELRRFPGLSHITIEEHAAQRPS